MGLLNLALGQLLGVFLPLAGLLVALYFYDRSRRRVLVSTLRFWPRRPAPALRQRHKRIQHPLSLLLQLVALLLLLLAIADPRPDVAGSSARQRVLLLDTSAATALSGGGGSRLIEEAKALALAYLDSVPSGDRVLLIEADGAPSVAVPFTLDRQRLREAILSAEPGWTALDLRAAFELAAGTLRLALDADGERLPDRPGIGEVVYTGPGRFSGQSVHPSALPQIRYLETSAPSDSLGLLAFRAIADTAEPGRWDVELVARNYGGDDSTFRVDFFFDDKLLGHRELKVPAGDDTELRFTLRTQRPGRLVARSATDEFEGNNEAAIEIPSVRRTRLQVVGGSEKAFEPLLASGALVEASFVDSRDDLAEGAIHVWARGGKAGNSRRAIYLAPPGTASPIGIAGSIRDRPIDKWSASHPLALGIRDRDLMPSRARVFEILDGDEIVAGTSEGPVVLARTSGGRKLVAFGFDLAGESVRGRLAAPLLFANAVSWLDAGAFRSESVEARAPGAVEIAAPNSSREQVAVRADDGRSVPWVLSEGSLRFYAGRRGTYRVTTADRDVTLFLNQPQIATASWDPSEEVARGLPASAARGPEPWLPWPWLASLAAAILLYDWIRFGRGRRLTAEAFAASDAGAGEGMP
jgi:hypothetical protein